jgi:cell wall-associated NlpC family hydrolase
MDSLVVRAIEAQPNWFAPLLFTKPADLLPGDLIGLKIGGCVNHLGIVLDVEGKFIHAMRRHNVMYSYTADATYWGRLKNAWRPQSAT